MAVVDSSKNVLLPKVNPPPSSLVSTFNFTNTMASGGVATPSGRTWSSSDVTLSTPADQQSGIPSGNALQIFTTPRGDVDDTKFLRLRSTHTNQPVTPRRKTVR